MKNMTEYYRPFRRVLVANRAEIAVRIIRALRDLHLESVAVYSDADADSTHRHLADFAVRLPGRTSAQTYLNVPELLRAAKAAGAEAVHPGYGFLSENAAFAQAVRDAGMVFIGPSPSAMQQMGDKVEAKRLMKLAGVPTVPGSEGPLRDAADLQAFAQMHGYPLILKAAAGGGGRGMRVVRQDSELAAALASCQREAQDYFGDPRVFCERYIERPRHIEFQVMCDSHGNGVHLFERDCSIQRRHQKLIEEAPSHFLNSEQRARLGAQALAAAQAVNYVGAGTVEFICESPDRCYFMEMNTRIQVEHPVTEMITGCDLVQEQIRAAQGKTLSWQQSDIQIKGWAFEARINAEDPAQDFMPSPNMITGLHLPAGPGIRWDTHIFAGYRIPQEYDSMIAKLIVHGATREEALDRMCRALRELVVEGVPTTARFHLALARHPLFRAAEIDTSFLAVHGGKLLPEPEPTIDIQEIGAIVTALTVAAKLQDQPPDATNSRQAWQDISRREALRSLT